MNKKLIIGIIAAVVVTAGAAAFFLLRQQDEATLVHNAVTGRGEATCTFTDPNTNDTGTLHVKDGRMLVVVSTEQNGESVKGNYLLRDDTGYFWTGGEKQGFKFATEQAESVEGAADKADLKDLSEEEFKKEYEKSEFSCESSVNQAMLEAPGDVEFTDFSDFSENLNQQLQQDADTQDLPSSEELKQQLRDLEEQYNY